MLKGEPALDDLRPLEPIELKAGMMVYALDKWLVLDECVTENGETAFWYASDSEGKDYEVYLHEIEELSCPFH